jgi:hypothetical protein
MTHRAKIVYDLTNSGDSMSDADVAYGRTYYKELADKLRQCGPVFKLAANEADRVYHTLDGFFKARQANR